MMTRFARCALLLQIVFRWLMFGSTVNGQEQSEPQQRRQVGVADVIEMTRLSDPDYSRSGSSIGHVAHFSPDGKQFVVILRKGNLEKNINEYSLLLFQTADAFHSPEPDRLLTMASSSNRDAIRAVKWLGDNETIAFLGENPGEASQIYTFSLRSRKLETLTSNPTAVTSYDITADGRQFIFEATLPVKNVAETGSARREGIVIGSQWLPDILAGNSNNSFENQVFFQKAQQPATPIPVEDTVYEDSPLSISPDGKYALIGGHVRDVPAWWADYRANSILHEFVISKRRKGLPTPLQRYLLIDTKNGSATELLDTPMLALNPTEWAPDGRAIYVGGTYLPLDATNPIQHEERTNKVYDVEVMLPNKAFRMIAKKDWPKQGSASRNLEVALEEDLNTPPKIHVSNPKTSQNARLLDLNPDFRDLKLGAVKTIEWEVAGIEIIGGLYLPPDYVPGKRYPLVIQTHGFVPKQFSMDGRSEWSSGFAARPLAANGIVVLQMYNFKDPRDHDRVSNDRNLGVNEKQSSKNFYVLAFEKAIDHLSDQGMIDRNRVGIVGFSRTVCFVAYALTHSKYKFAAASLVDGIDCGYFQYFAFPDYPSDLNDLNGGAPPFGDGLQKWLHESPGFNLDKVNTPVRLVALQPFSVLEAWEWFAGLNFQGKPVDLIEVPDASHFIEKPWERRTAQQGMVDWFRFWLQAEEDPVPGKHDQYARWRALKEEYSMENSYRIEMKSGKVKR